MSKILAIDTSHSLCSVAFNNSGKIDALSTDQPRQHARRLLPMIEELLVRNATKLTELDAIAFVSGPGSFTGLRIGAGVAQGLALGSQLPVLGLSSMAVMALKASLIVPATEFVICMLAREQELYSAVYRSQDHDVQLQGEEFVGGIDSIPFAQIKSPQDVCLVGDARELAARGIAEKYGMSMRSYPEECVSDAQTLSILAAARFAQGEAVHASLALPVYLKEQMDYQE